MTKDRKRRAARRKLNAHDAGQDRHAKGVEFLKKESRAETERSRLGMKRRKKKSKTPSLKQGYVWTPCPDCRPADSACSTCRGTGGSLRWVERVS